MHLFTLPAGRRARRVILVCWAIVFLVLAPQALKFNEAQSNRDVSYLPKSADSLAAIELEEQAFGDELLTGLLLYHADHKLLPRDRAAVVSGTRQINGEPLPGQYGRARAVFLPDGRSASIYFQMRAHGDKQVLYAAADRLERVAAEAPPGVDTKLTGQAGFFNDQAEIFDEIDRKLLIGSVILISVLLLLIYRSPFLWLLPLASVGVAEVTARGLSTTLTDYGVTLTSQAAALMTVLVFGVGTDYALLVIARYREELRRCEHVEDAMGTALLRTAPTILASGMTVIAALMCMTLADVNGTAGAGPIGALGIAVAMISTLTLLPAMLLLFGRGVFWPGVPRVGTAVAAQNEGFWPRLADFIARNAGRVVVCVALLMAVMAIGLTTKPGGLDLAESFHDSVPSVEGMNELERVLPPGATGPMTVLVGDSVQVPGVLRTLKSSTDVSLVNLVQRAGGVTRIEAMLPFSPYSEQAIDAVERVRSQLGAAALVSGATAVEADSREFAAHDNRVIMPLVLLVVFIVLLVLLRSIVAPLVLMLTVVASFLAVMGCSYLLFDHLFGFSGVDEYVPLFVFIFLVALGVDYNIFLMARVREDVAEHGAREAMRRGLIVTGGVITSAGLVLAGTFFVMAAMPITVLTEMGFAVAIGVLFDALIVRTALVPALGFLLGERMWWPSRISAGADAPQKP
jgi:RND superfamily putative drug exporter